MTNASEIKFTEKERAVLWAIACWFDTPVVSSSLKYRLYADSNNKILKKYDKPIEDRIIELGKWLEKRSLKNET